MLAILWCKGLPPEIVNTMPVPMALARGYAAEGNWKEAKTAGRKSGRARRAKPVPLLKLAANSAPLRDWKSFEFMRLALLAHALRDHGNADQWQVVWGAAVKAASDRPAALSVLARATVDWKWEQESTDLLWRVARGPDEQMWALNILYSTYEASRATRNILQVLTRMYEIDPTNASVRHNLACLWLLLQTNLDQATKLAEDLHRDNPNDPASISLLAFALYMQGKTEEGVDLMRKLGEEKLRQPLYAAYFGVMLAGAGKRDQAKEFLQIGRRAPLLPEERVMVERAVASTGR
jgi:tetratricopeptide (TPR) repeat protein